MIIIIIDNNYPAIWRKGLVNVQTVSQTQVKKLNKQIINCLIKLLHVANNNMTHIK